MTRKSIASASPSPKAMASPKGTTCSIKKPTEASAISVQSKTKNMQSAFSTVQSTVNKTSKLSTTGTMMTNDRTRAPNPYESRPPNPYEDSSITVGGVTKTIPKKKVAVVKVKRAATNKNQKIKQSKQSKGIQPRRLEYTEVTGRPLATILSVFVLFGTSTLYLVACGIPYLIQVMVGTRQRIDWLKSKNAGG